MNNSDVLIKGYIKQQIVLIFEDILSSELTCLKHKNGEG